MSEQATGIILRVRLRLLILERKEYDKLFICFNAGTMGSVPDFKTFPIFHHRGTETHRGKDVDAERGAWKRGHPLALFSRAERTANDKLHASDIGHQRTHGGGRTSDDRGRQSSAPHRTDQRV